MAHPRSGSNCVVEILDAHPALSVLNEPFNENFARWQEDNPDYRARLRDTGALDEVLAEMFATYCGIKTLGFQLSSPLREHLLLRPDVQVVVLRRRSLLEAVVSNLIALQTNLWKTWDAVGPIEDYFEQLVSIPIDEAQRLLDATKAVLDDIDGVVARRHDGEVLRLWYEDLLPR